MKSLSEKFENLVKEHGVKEVRTVIRQYKGTHADSGCPTQICPAGQFWNEILCVCQDDIG